jgi:hypothetical protein
MAAMSLAAKLLARLEDAARLAFGGGFRTLGVTIQHPGLLLDQERGAEVVGRVVSALAKRSHRARTIDELLRRIDVRIFPARARDGIRVDVDARWLGGIGDRGRILVRHSADWPDRFGRALLALLLVELEPGTAPEEVGLNVTEEPDV